MNVAAHYKVRNEVLGPRPLDEIRIEIREGLLPADTPLKLTTDGLWTDLRGAEQKLVRLKPSGFPRSRAINFFALNIALAAIGFFWPFVCLLGGGSQYILGLLVNYFEEGKRRPAVAFATLVSMMFPLFVVVGSGERAKPLVLWLIFSGFFQFVLFILFLRLKFG